MERRYQHDCEQCVCLGQWEEFDLYFCPNKHNPNLATLLARYGNEPREYASTNVGYTKRLIDLHNHEYPSHSFALRVAFLIADDLNYLGRYRDAHVKAYRVIKYERGKSDIVSKLIPNEKETYRIAYNKQSFTDLDEARGVRVEIVQVINASDDWSNE